MNQEYLKCQRKEVSEHAKFLLCAKAIILSIVWIVIYLIDDDMRQGMIVLAVVGSLSTIFLGIMKAIARYKTICVDLFGTAYMIGYIVAFATLSLTNWIDLSPQ